MKGLGRLLILILFTLGIVLVPFPLVRFVLYWMSSLMLLSFLYSLLLRSFLRVELDFETKKSFPGQMTQY
jgi:hypothetical protein